MVLGLGREPCMQGSLPKPSDENPQMDPFFQVFGSRKAASMAAFWVIDRIAFLLSHALGGFGFLAIFQHLETNYLIILYLKTHRDGAIGEGKGVVIGGEERKRKMLRG